MELENLKVDRWTVETAQMKHTSRKYTMASVSQSWLRKFAAECGVDDYQKLLEDFRDNPETYEAMTEPEREFCDTASSVGVWTTIGACVRPYIGIDEWLKLPEDTVNGLAEAVEKLNPHWLVVPDQEKKIKKSRPRSTKK